MPDSVLDWDSLWARVTSIVDLSGIQSKEEFEQAMVNDFFRGKATGNRMAIVDELWNRGYASFPTEKELGREGEVAPPSRRIKGKRVGVRKQPLEAIPTVEIPSELTRGPVAEPGVAPQEVSPSESINQRIQQISDNVAARTNPVTLGQRINNVAIGVRDRVADLLSGLAERIRRLGGR